MALSIAGAAALGWDVVAYGTRASEFGATGEIIVALVGLIIWAYAWMSSASRMRTPIVVAMMVTIIVQMLTGHVYAHDWINIIDDCAWIAGAIILSQRLQGGTKTYQTVEETLSALDIRNPNAQ